MLRKKKTSLIINNATPKDIPFCTLSVWEPKKVPSVMTSLNHNAIPQFNKIKENNNNKSPIGYPWKDKTAEVVKDNKTPDNKIGHGDWSTIW